MSEEIKEILYLQNYIDKYKSDEKAIIKGNRLTTPAMLDYLEVKALLNCITNLQQKAEQLENIRKEAIECIETDSIEINTKEYGNLTVINSDDLLNILNKGDSNE